MKLIEDLFEFAYTYDTTLTIELKINCTKGVYHMTNNIIIYPTSFIDEIN